MSNTSSGTAGDSLAALSDSYFQWLEKDVLPIITGLSLVIVIILGVILNAVVIHAFAKKRIRILSSAFLFWQLVAVDFIAYIFVLFPGIVSAIAKDWVLSSGFCTFHSVVNTLCFLLTFAFLTILCVEKSVSFISSNFHSATFENNKLCIVVCILTWISGLLGSLMPTFGWGVIEYLTYEMKCSLNHAKNKTNMILVFLLGLFIPFVVTIAFTFVAVYKRKDIIQNLNSVNKKVKLVNDKMAREHDNMVVEDLTEDKVDSSIDLEKRRESVKETPGLQTPRAISPSGNRISPVLDKDDTPPVTTRSEQEMERDIIMHGAATNKKSLNAVNVAQTVFASSIEHNHFHFAVTFTLMWLTSLALWLPYVTLLFLDIYDVISVWNGWFTISGLLCDVTYCIKPIVFMSHNRKFRRAAAKSVPESLRKRASRASRALSRTLRRMDEIVFIRVGDDAVPKTTMSDTEEAKDTNSECYDFKRQKVNTRTDVKVTSSLVEIE